jgi:hypothetical protein
MSGVDDQLPKSSVDRMWMNVCFDDGRNMRLCGEATLSLVCPAKDYVEVTPDRLRFPC